MNGLPARFRAWRKPPPAVGVGAVVLLHGQPFVVRSTSVHTGDARAAATLDLERLP